ncbi:uncharacterized protein [Lolium perenne]|uniref:uncharacterized protein isoform X1 n=1 Tax=Lolium perenne TaxID=4522 RepID=UPI0021EB211E|nr:uncharacterized protein LOC127295213 isoform X1 [Lolium perenne]
MRPKAGALASASEAPRAPHPNTPSLPEENRGRVEQTKRDRGRKKKMVAMGAEDDERPVHQGCMAGFLHLFDRPQILSAKRLHHHPRRLLSSSSGSATPSEMSMPLDRGSERATPLPLSPDMTPPAAPRPSLQLPPLDLKDRSGAAASWRLPRLSLDSRAVVDAKGKLRPRDIRTSSPSGAPPSPGMGGDERRSPSVVARLMGLDALPHGAGDEEDGQHAARGGELRRSASERVPRDPARFRFVDPTFFEKPAPPVLLPPQRPSSPATEVALRRSPDPAYHRAALQRRSSHFDAREVFPEPAKRVDPSAGQGEIALYGEIERRLRKRGIAEPARDLETLKQILEALQLKGLLHHAPPAPVSVRNHPPPIVVMRPNSRPPQPPLARTSPTRRLRVEVDSARRPRSPGRDASPARSPASPARRGPQSPQRRVSPAQSPKQQLKKPTNAELPSVRARIARRAAHNAAAALTPDDDASTTFSDGGSNSTVSASSRWDLEQRPRLEDHGLLERCGKLLSSIHAFTSVGDAAADQQPSPVSVLDAAAFLADEDSPSSSGSKRGMDFRAPSPRPVVVASDLDDDEWVPESWLVGPQASDPDFAYVAEVIRLLDRMKEPDDVYRTIEKRRQRGEDTWQHRRLLCGVAAEAFGRWRCAHPSEPVAWLRGEELLRHVWAEVQRAREPVAPAADDLNDLTCGVILRDLAADRRWSPSAEAAETVLQIERLLFKDLVADTIRELADVDRLRLPRRKLVF